MRTSFLLLAILPFLLISCQSKEKTPANDESILEDRGNTTLIPNWKIYSGILPCADCSGIETTLGIDDVNHLYELNNNYLDKKDGEFEESGPITITTGYGDDTEAKLITLISEGRIHSDSTYYLKPSSGEDRLIRLDRDKNRISSELNYTLTLDM